MVTIYHNPNCSKSRATLDLIRQAGVEPEVVLYVKAPPTRDKLESLISKMGMTPRALLRKGKQFDELGLDNPDLTDAELVEAMIAHPNLINRPIVETPKGTKLCRPPEEVLSLL